MAGNRDAVGRRDLEELVRRAQADLKNWTETTEHDPGVTLLELFAYVAELLSSVSERISRESFLETGRHDRHTDYSSVLHQPGRVVVDTDWGDQRSLLTCGVHAAVVVDDSDPEQQQRLRVEVPEVTGDQAVWAAACVPASGSAAGPAIGEGVWVAYESADPSRPVWLGRRLTD